MKKAKHIGVITSFHQVTLLASLEELKAVLGEPEYHTQDTDEKVQYNWNLETEDGRPFTIYDWKEYRKFDDTEVIEWHVGGKDSASCFEGKREFVDAITKLTTFTLKIK